MTIYSLNRHFRRNDPYTFDEPPSDFPPPYTYADALQAQIYQNSWNIQRLFKSIQILGQKVALIENNISQYNAENRTTKKDIQSLRKEIQDLKNTLSSTANNRDDAISKLQKTVTKIELTLSSHQKNAKEENTRLKDLISSLEMRLEMQTLDLQNEVQERKQELETMHAQTRASSDQNQIDMANQIASFEKQLDLLAKKLQEQKEQKQEKLDQGSAVKDIPATLPVPNHKKNGHSRDPVPSPAIPTPPKSIKSKKAAHPTTTIESKKPHNPKSIDPKTSLNPKHMSDKQFESVLETFSTVPKAGSNSNTPHFKKEKGEENRLSTFLASRQASLDLSWKPMIRKQNLATNPQAPSNDPISGIDLLATNDAIRWSYWARKVLLPCSS